MQRNLHSNFIFMPLGSKWLHKKFLKKFIIYIYVVKTSSSFHIDFQETQRFDPVSFAGASDFIRRTDNALRTVKPFSFPLIIKDSLSSITTLKSVCQALNP